jgi:hypothetical protein
VLRNKLLRESSPFGLLVMGISFEAMRKANEQRNADEHRATGTIRHHPIAAAFAPRTST